jgi:hypothetical protein
MPEIKVKGYLCEYREDGRGTPVWCIVPDKPSPAADIEWGMVRIRRGDLLTIFNAQSDKVAWSGAVRLKRTGESWPAAADYLAGFTPSAWEKLCWSRPRAILTRRG